MRKLSLVDETFDLNFISEYHMSIQLSLDGLSFCILDSIQKKYVCLVHHSILSNTTELSVKRLKELFEKEEYLKPEYKSTQILFTGSKGTLIPAPYSHKESIKQLFEINFGETKSEKIVSTTLAPFTDLLAYSIPTSLVSFIKERYQDTPIQHECNPFLWNVTQQGNIDNQLAILVREKYCWIVYMKGGKLKFINSFATQSDDDVLFYTLNIVSKLEIDPEKTPLLVDGVTSKKAANYHRFRQYIKFVKLAEPSNDYQYSYHFSQLPDNRFNCLLNSYACEL